jgi:hypothetical protein
MSWSVIMVWHGQQKSSDGDGRQEPAVSAADEGVANSDRTGLIPPARGRRRTHEQQVHTVWAMATI